jgi:predicted Rossmann-fold nucleotide-binding protein
MRVGWTGHRPDLFAQPDRVRSSLESIARDLVEREGAKGFVTGGQRGVDTWAADAALSLGVRLTLLLPLGLVDESWTEADVRALERLRAVAREVRTVDSFSRRNRLVAESVDLLVAVWTGTRGGGTEETIGFARTAGTPVREHHFDGSTLTQPPIGRGL